MTPREESLRKLKEQRDLLQGRMQEEASDLDFETHLERIRTLQRVIEKMENKEREHCPIA